MRFFIALALCALAPFVSRPTSAQPAAGTHGDVRQVAVATASVLVGGRQVALLGPAAGLTPQERAQRMRDGLERAVTTETLASLAPGDVDVAWRLRQPVVTVRGIPLVTVTSTDASLAGEPPAATAARWARALRSGLDRLRATTSSGPLGTFVAIVPGTAVFHGGGAGGGPAGR